MRRLIGKYKPGHRASNSAESSDKYVGLKHSSVAISKLDCELTLSYQACSTERQPQQGGTPKPEQDSVATQSGESKSDKPEPSLFTSLHYQEFSLLEQTTSEALWSQAYSALKAKESDITLAYEHYFTSGRGSLKPAERMEEVIHRLYNGRRMDQLKISLGGKSFRIREIGENIINFLWESKDFVASIASVEPHAALAWAGVSQLLPVRPARVYLTISSPQIRMHSTIGSSRLA